MLQYIPLSNLPYSHIPLHHPSLAISTKCTRIIMHGTCLSGLYPVPFTHNSHDYPHFNIYISFGGPKYCITALNTYVIPLLHRILTTQFIYTYANITKKSPLKSPKHKNILFFNHNT
ncbi:AVB_G0038860.mRNA.1.CDS.1 [Saccharomyces cerevisiae]|nr:AVB_G0004770.mRNA.1.CDS.1 [Saccharomyces cerevisiae]CAI4409338.1 AIE_G0027820.mRNA.1.CDS.1 [Saccharomyces cerevisiae]CAI4622281.1 AVB_G0038860.mRNA.1.CDS.1 [Saccharomyces cerevisiae]CAI6613485.1 AIE_G0027820.mRNA.1.CDS.1 [Saccharomyces cerevisiae]CAI7051538.1 AVB_G0004770.mRNA.1.CDS.1 [Saccharomyces cerevisiae]